MAQIQKLIDKLTRIPPPADFGWSQLERLLNHYGYKPKQGSGSRVKFIHTKTKSVISLHKRHPDSDLLEYQIELVLEKLRDEGHKI